jgi:hypothetical protein
VEAGGPHLHIDLSLHLPCAVAAGFGKGRRWSTVRYWSHGHTTSIPQKGGTTTGSTWTKDGERRQAEPIVEFAQALHQQAGRGRLVCWHLSQHICHILWEVNHRLREHPHAPAVGFSARGGEIGRGQDASKKGGDHLASSLEVKRGQQRPSPPLFAPWEVRVRGIGACKIALEGQKVESYRLWEKRKAGVFADLPQAKAAKSTTATTARKPPQEGGRIEAYRSDDELCSSRKNRCLLEQMI